MRCRLPILLLAALLAPPVLRAQAPVPAARTADQPAEQIDAYVALVQADQARNRGQWKTAIQQYREAMKQYALLVEKYPNWNPEIVQYRLTYCGNEVQAILQKTGKTEAELLAGQAVTPEDENASYKDRFEAVRRDNEKAREELAQLRKDIALKEAVAKAQSDDARRTEADNNRLRLALAAAQGQNDRTATELEQRRAEATQYKSLLDEAKNAIDRLQREKKVVEQARFESERQLAEQGRTLEDARRGAGEFEAKAETLQKQLGGLQGDLSLREQQLRALTNDLARAQLEGDRLQRELKATGKVDAERYKKMADEARVASEGLAARLSAAQKEIALRTDTQATLLAEQKRLTNTVLELKLSLADLQRERDQLKDSTARLPDLLEAHARATNEVLGLKAKVAAGERAAESLRKELADARDLAGSAAALQARLAEAQKKSDAQKVALALAEKERDDARAAAALAAKEAAKARSLAANASEERVELSRRLEEQAAAAAKLAAEKKALEQQIADAGEGVHKVASLQADLGESRQKLAAATAELEQMRKAAGDGPRIRELLAAREVEIEMLRKDTQTLQAELVLARNEAKAAIARTAPLVTTAEGLKTRLAELTAQHADREKQALRQQQDAEMLKAQYDTAKASATEAAGRAAKLEKQISTLAADHLVQEDQLKKRIAALLETMELRDKELAGLRDTVKDMRDQLEQLSNSNRLLQTENARLKR